MQLIGLRRLGLAALLSGGVALPAQAIIITTSNDAFGLANTLFLNVGGLQVNSAQYSSAALTSGSNLFQSGTFINLQGTFGLPSPGIVLSTGNVNDFATGANAENTTGFGFGSTGFGVAATPGQNALLAPITGVSNHFDVVQLDIGFFSAGPTTATFFATFGSMEFPNFVGSSFIDGFGLYVNDVNVAGVRSTDGIPGLPVNINHPDMQGGFPGTILSGDEVGGGGVLAPNGNPVLRFDVPIAAGTNNFTIILGDASDSILDTTVYLSSFFASGGGGGQPGATEFNPVLPSNPPGPDGTFVIEIPVVDPGTVVWIDPPVSIGFEYEVLGGPAFASILAPSLATVPDLDGYFITVGDTTVPLAPGAALDFLTAFGVQPTLFTLTGIDPALMLDPSDPLAFPLGVAFNVVSFETTVLMTPITADFGNGETPAPIPLPASVLLYLAGMAVAGGVLRRRKAA